MGTVGLCPCRAGDIGPLLSSSTKSHSGLHLIFTAYDLRYLGESILEASPSGRNQEDPAKFCNPQQLLSRWGGARPGAGLILRTCTGRICTWEARHCTLRLLQQPEQRCTSTQGGHTRKLALVRSMRFREIWNTSVRVLHSAITAGSAAASEPGRKRSVRSRPTSLEPLPSIHSPELG